MPDPLQDYIIKTAKNLESGALVNFADPAAPGDLGTALDQDQIDQLKTLLQEINNRFTTP
jgi:hypothetical protein